MELLIEIILELVLEGSLEASQNPKLPRVLRYLLLTLVLLFIVGVIAIIIIAGIYAWKINVLASIFLIVLGVTLLIIAIKRFKDGYKRKLNELE